MKWCDFGVDDDRCRRCGRRYARKDSAGKFHSPGWPCLMRWERILNVIRAEREDAAAAREEAKEHEKQSDLYHASASAAADLAVALRAALGSENVLDESHELFRIRRLLDRLEDTLEEHSL